jgi:two-component system sensor histidine kinase UhpB
MVVSLCLLFIGIFVCPIWQAMSRKNIFLLVIFSTASISICRSQNQRILDSLITVLKTAKEDTNKVNLLIKISRQYMNVNPEPMLPYIKQAGALSDKLNYDKGKFLAGNATAFYYYIINDLKMAFQYAESNLKIAEQHNKADELFMSYNTLASIYDARGEFKLATPFRLKTLEIAEKLKDDGRLASANFNMGINYESLGNYTEALQYYFKALKVREAKKDSVGLASVYGAIGDVYSHLYDFVNGRKYHLQSLSFSEKIDDVRDMISSYYRLSVISFEENKLEEAKKYSLLCLEYCNENSDLPMTAASYQTLGQISDAEENYEQALNYYKQALSIFQLLGDKMGISDASRFAGIEYGKKNNFNKALYYLQMSRATADSIGFKSSLVSVYRNLADAYAQSNDYKKAYQYSLLHNELGDSLLNVETISKTAEMREKYEAENKEKEIAILNKDKEIQSIEIKKQKLLKYSFIGGLMLSLLLFIFGYRVYRARQVLQLQAIRNRIADDLHDDIGSTLNSISIYSEVAKQKSPNVISELEQIGEASRKIIDALSDIVWAINTKNDSFEQIILRLRSLTFNLLRAKNIEHTFRVDESLNSMKLSMEQRRNFYLIFKEILNNLVKYSNASLVKISLIQENNFIVLHIHDNGIGFDAKKAYTGNGLLSMNTRAEEMKAVLKVESEKGSGTNIELKWKA